MGVTLKTDFFWGGGEGRGVYQFFLFFFCFFFLLLFLFVCLF